MVHLHEMICALWYNVLLFYADMLSVRHVIPVVVCCAALAKIGHQYGLLNIPVLLYSCSNSVIEI